ncbi:mismatch-specific DNA-glycosylase [Pullulanibacillus camelliae]|uniref:Mismatch-specific DNA-glycosylase n=1 Tax=Pullulanibacillus camelliae TaxID=1707096 RepID=A0A8J2VSW6_9BACL|nr:mismatch-specific DNA-glycosylase [Pullulanibacillus camelliae]GGE39597.1 mismatch-specific DNA-glycosylase [Pullulanibacillus camelliae]
MTASLLRDVIAKDLSILFIGFNPSLRSAEVGHHYASPNNRFWTILYRSGLTPYQLSADEDTHLLKWGYGSTNIVDRPTKAADEITPQEYAEGRIKLKEKLKTYQPKCACYVGKGVYLQFARLKSAPWGKQSYSQVEGMIDFVVPSSSGLVRMKIDEIVSIYSQLKNL